MTEILRHLRAALVVLIAAIGTGGALTSCDSMIATTLEGTWEGDMYVSSYYDGRDYYASHTEIEFLLDPLKFKTGRGYWVDYYSRAPWDYIANHFRWTVTDRVIRIHLEEDRYDLEIRNYELDDDYFSGDVFYEGESRHFHLYHTSSPNWDEFHYGWDAPYYLPALPTDGPTLGGHAVGRPERRMRPLGTTMQP